MSAVFGIFMVSGRPRRDFSDEKGLFRCAVAVPGGVDLQVLLICSIEGSSPRKKLGGGFNLVIQSDLFGVVK